MTLGILATRDSEFAAGDFHTMVGLLWLIPAFLIYMGIVWILKQLIVDDEPSARSGGEEEEGVHIRFASNTKFAFLAAVVLLIGGGLSIQIAAKSLGVYLKKEPVAPRLRSTRFHTRWDRGSPPASRNTGWMTPEVEQLGAETISLGSTSIRSVG